MHNIIVLVVLQFDAIIETTLQSIPGKKTSAHQEK